MAELLVANGWVKPGSTGAYLRETLPDDYFVVSDATVLRHHLAAAVVGHTGIFAIEAEDDASGPSDHPASALPRNEPGRNGAEEQTIRAMRRFLRDEFPGLTPPVCVLTAVRDWASELTTWRVMQPHEWADQPLAETVLAADAQDFRFESEEDRTALAVGLCDRQLTVTQAASKPFVFRTGRALRVGARVTTIQEAVEHMVRYPADGMHHLRDGTLAAWLEEEGAHHLAALARDVIRRPRLDMAVALETFLLGTGLVGRPQLACKPEVIDLGYATQGQKASRLLRLTKRRSRGHLFGELTTTDAWLTTEPREFVGSPAAIVVTADTSSLPISPHPAEAEVLIRSSAANEPIGLPVRIRVVALPGPLIRWLARPLLALLAGLLLGVGFGAWWEITGVGGGRVALGTWAAILGTVWAWAGLARGIKQPAAWPARYALTRWLGRALAWSAGLAALAALIVLAWRNGFGGGLDIPGLTVWAAAAIGAAFAFVPVTPDELANSRHVRESGYVQGRTSRRRAALLGGAGAILVLGALLAPRFIAPAVRGLQSDAAYAPARAWLTERWLELSETMDRLMDDLTMRYYDQPGGARSEPSRVTLPEWVRSN